MATNISTIRVDATKEKVWDSLTKPALVKRWQYGSELITNWKVDSGIRFRTEWEGKVFEQWGKVLAFQSFKLLKYSLFAPRPGLEDKPKNYFIMSYNLTPENAQIKLEIIQEGNRPNAVQEEPQGDNSPFLQLLKKVAESE